MQCMDGYLVKLSTKASCSACTRSSDSCCSFSLPSLSTGPQ